MKLQFLVVVCIVVSFAAAGGNEEQLDQLCEGDDEKVQMYEAFVKPMKECLAELQPNLTKALTECNIQIFGSDPKTAAEIKEYFCPKDEAKMKAFGECMAGKGIKQLDREETKEAKKKMNECIGKKATDRSH
ncbi:hypothetical protein EC968_003262 [Mortierella alpina]|nr:hypothetical protein EC968_003262 [Mortierella alpina]